MRARSLLLGSLVVPAVWVAHPSAARACSCMPPKPPAEAAAQAAAVFEGTPQQITEDDGQLRVSFAVRRVWKGEVSPEQTLVTANNSAACGREFQPNTAYVVYAYAVNGGLGDGLCTRTLPLARASEDLAALGNGRPPGASDGPSPEVDPVPEPSAEPPRIEPPPLEVQPAEPNARGCTVSEKPHTRPSWVAWMVLVMLAPRRARAVRSPQRRAG